MNEKFDGARFLPIVTDYQPRIYDLEISNKVTDVGRKILDELLKNRRIYKLVQQNLDVNPCSEVMISKQYNISENESETYEQLYF